MLQRIETDVIGKAHQRGELIISDIGCQLVNAGAELSQALQEPAVGFSLRDDHTLGDILGIAPANSPDASRAFIRFQFAGLAHADDIEASLIYRPIGG